MGKETEIAWCDHTFNGWWGCTRVSPGCENCYAEEWAARFGTGWGVSAPRRFFGDKHWNEPLAWDRAARAAGVRRRVFSASMSDAFEDRRDLDRQRYRLWELINSTRGLDWLLLTKRPENVERFAPSEWYQRGFPDNVWIGTTVEDRKRAAERLPVLRQIPAAVRFASFEPLLEDLGDVDLTGVDWGIVGGESGGKARQFELGWWSHLLLRMRAAGTAPFFKQAGDNAAIRMAPGEHGQVIPVGALGRKGGDIAALPNAYAAVREFPVPRLHDKATW